MTTRELICKELRKRSYPQTAEMLRAKIGKTTVQFLCRCLALERNVIERKIRGQLWYGMRPDQFKPYRVEYDTGARRGHQWRVLAFQGSKRGATMLAAHWAKQDKDTVYRVVYRNEFIEVVFNNESHKEQESWHDAKRTLRELRQVLRDPSHWPSRAATPAPSSPR